MYWSCTPCTSAQLPHKLPFHTACFEISLWFVLSGETYRLHNMQNHLKTAAFSVLALLTHSIAFAQTEDAYEAFKRKREQEMQQFQTAQQHALDSLRDAQNREFGLLLEGKWSERKVGETPKAIEKPKPVDPPRFTPLTTKKSVEKIDIALPRDLKKSQAIDLPEPKATEKEKTEIEEKKEAAPLGENRLESVLEGLATQQIEYYGTHTLAPTLVTWPKIKMPVKPENIADYWKRCSEIKNDTYLRYLEAQREQMQLSDWGTIKLLDEWIASNQLSNADAALFKWFWCTQLGYDVRLMYHSDQIALGYPFVETFYGQRFMPFGDVKYFLLDNPSIERMYTYDGKHPGATKFFTLAQNPESVFPENTQERILQFTFEKKRYEIPFYYNSYRAQYYSDIPLTDLSFYFRQPGAQAWDESVYTALRATLNNFSTDRERVRFLYALVNDGIPYETDAAQFNKEKCCLPEEALSYSKADCEDRTFLLNYLIRTLVGVRTIGLRYPAHVSMAVDLSEVQSEDATITYDGRTYVYCDPTYIGADVGMMPESYQALKPEVIE